MVVNSAHLDLNVVGVHESGLQFFEAMNVYAPLYYLQEVTNTTGLVSEILIKLENPSMAQEIASTLQNLFPELRAIVQTTQVRQVTQVLSTLSLFFLTIGLIAIIAGGFGVTNTMLINVFERSRDIGILRAIGASSKIALSLFLIEALLLGLIGGIVGLGFGTVLAHILPSYFPLQVASKALPGVRRFRELSPRQAQLAITPLITWENIALSTILGVTVSVISGLYPAWRASRIRPVEVLRHA